MTSGWRIAVLGAGEDVTLIEQWPDHVEAMRRDGVTIAMATGQFTQHVRCLRLCEVATLRHRFEIVLMLMKAYDSRWSAQLIEPYLSDDGLLVGVQNGMTIDTVAELVGAHRTMGCVIEITSAMLEPGIVERHSPPSRSWFAVGGIDAATKGREEEIASLLRHSGAVEVVDHIRATKWMKLVSNATTLVTTACLGLSMVEAAADARMRELMLRCGQEALDATKALGNPVLPIFGLTHDDMGEDATVVEHLLDTLLTGFVLRESKTTVLQDWMKGRHSEVDDLNGLVAGTLRAHGRAAPRTRQLWRSPTSSSAANWCLGRAISPSCSSAREARACSHQYRTSPPVTAGIRQAGVLRPASQAAAAPRPRGCPRRPAGIAASREPRMST